MDHLNISEKGNYSYVALGERKERKKYFGKPRSQRERKYGRELEEGKKKKGNKEEIRNEKGMETDILKWRSRYILPPLSSKTS